jgi:hypothetical protein
MTDMLAFSFIVDMDGEETQIAYCAKQVHPRKGELIWMPYNWERKEEFGTRAFIVTHIAHHMPTQAMNIYTEGRYDNIVVYCTPIKEK